MSKSEIVRLVLFFRAAILASDYENCKNNLPRLHKTDITYLEDNIGKMQEELPLLQSFILPGGHTIVSYYHICRCKCRKTERLAQNVSDHYYPLPLVTKFLNRLSDYFFVLARQLTADLKAEEIIWKPNLEK